jgi:hypothetical protein
MILSRQWTLHDIRDVEAFAADIIRNYRGRTKWRFRDRVYERPRTQLVGLDVVEQDRLEQALTPVAGDPADDRDSLFGGLLEEGDRSRSRDLATLGLEPTR